MGNGRAARDRGGAAGYVAYARGSGPGLCDLLLCLYWFFLAAVYKFICSILYFFVSLDLIFLSFVVFALFRPESTILHPGANAPGVNSKIKKIEKKFKKF